MPLALIYDRSDRAPPRLKSDEGLGRQRSRNICAGYEREPHLPHLITGNHESTERKPHRHKNLTTIAFSDVARLVTV